MDALKIVDQILVGSENIDRMRKETVQIICLLMGFAKYIPLTTNEDLGEYKFSCDEGIWRVKLKVEQGRVVNGGPMVPMVKGDFEIEFWIEDECVFYISKSEFRDTQQINSAPIQHVHVVHQSLLILIQGLVTLLPEIEKKWQPLIMASRI